MLTRSVPEYAGSRGGSDSSCAGSHLLGAHCGDEARDRNQVKMIACGHNHSLVMTVHGRVYGFGENLRGQIDRVDCRKMGNLFYRKPHRVPFLNRQPREKVRRLYASAGLSAVRIEDKEDGKPSRKFFAWGDRKMIANLAEASANQSTSSVSFSGAAARKCGAKARGGQSSQLENMVLLDQRMEGKQPLDLYMGHDNVALLQERFSEAPRRN